jgi:capsular polysaccharide biosynthesis protein
MKFADLPVRSLEDSAPQVESIISATPSEGGGVCYQQLAPPCSYAHEPFLVSGDSPPGFLKTKFVANAQLCSCVCNATVFGKGLFLDAAGNLVCSDSLGIRPQDLEDPLRRGTGRQIVAFSGVDASWIRRKRLGGRAVLLSALGEHIWGHWLLDILPRIFLARKCGIEDAVFLVGCDSRPFAFELLERFGVARSQVFVYDPAIEMVECEQLIVPSLCRSGVSVHPLLVDFYRGREARQQEGRRDFFVSRAGWQPNKRVMENRPEVEDLCRRLGFSIVFPEALSVDEQIELFASARMVIGDAGSGLHSTLFSPPGTKVLVLRNPEFTGVSIQLGIAGIFDQVVGLVNGQEVERAGVQGFGSYRVDLALLEAAIMDLRGAA